MKKTRIISRPTSSVYNYKENQDVMTGFLDNKTQADLLACSIIDSTRVARFLDNKLDSEVAH